MWTLTTGYCIRCLCVTRSAPLSPAYTGRDSTTTHIFLCYANLVVTFYLSRTRTKLRQRWKVALRATCNFVGKRSGGRVARSVGRHKRCGVASDGRERATTWRLRCAQAQGARTLVHELQGRGSPAWWVVPKGPSTRREGGPKDHGRGALYNRVRELRQPRMHTGLQVPGRGSQRTAAQVAAHNRKR